MDVSKILAPASKRLDLGQHGGDEGDFVVLKIIPLKARYQIDRAKSQGMDYGKVLELYQARDHKPLTQEEINEVVKSGQWKDIVKDDYDGGVEAKLLSLTVAVDPNDHSFVDENGNKIQLTRAFWESLGTNSEELFNYIYSELVAYQVEMRLGELNGTR